MSVHVRTVQGKKLCIECDKHVYVGTREELK
jgi:hypothetical protein